MLNNTYRRTSDFYCIRIHSILFHKFFSALEYCLDVEKLNLSTIRTVRVLRPLRAINRIPSEYENIENFTDKWNNIEDGFKAYCGLMRARNKNCTAVRYRFF